MADNEAPCGQERNPEFEDMLDNLNRSLGKREGRDYGAMPKLPAIESDRWGADNLLNQHKKRSTFPTTEYQYLSPQDQAMMEAQRRGWERFYTEKYGGEDSNKPYAPTRRFTHVELQHARKQYSGMTPDEIEEHAYREMKGPEPDRDAMAKRARKAKEDAMKALQDRVKERENEKDEAATEPSNTTNGECVDISLEDSLEAPFKNQQISSASTKGNPRA